MKLKILLVPFMIVLGIWFAIAIGAPAFSEAKMQKELLDRENEKVEDAREKNRNVEALAAELRASTRQKDVLMGYLPSASQEENLINSLNDIASATGLSVFNIAVSRAKTETPAAAGSEGNIGEPALAGLAGGEDDAMEGEIFAPKIAEPKNIEAELGAAGSYENIKILADRLAKLKRFVRVSSMNITGADSGGEEATAPGNNLKVEFKLGFNYLEAAKSVARADGALFAAGKFDMSVISDIESRTGTDVVRVEAGSAGKTNPFTP